MSVRRRGFAWPLVMGLVGLDYFSTLAYQPSLAYESAGLLAPITGAVVIVLTLVFIVPIYWYVAGRSPGGQGATGLIESTVPGWPGKMLMLVLLGFAAADFVLTRTISAADATVHFLENPAWRAHLDSVAGPAGSWVDFLPHRIANALHRQPSRHLLVTLVLSVLTFGFWAVFRRGFTRQIVRLAAGVVLAYLILTGWILFAGLHFLMQHPNIMADWWQQIQDGARRDPAHWGLPWASLARDVVFSLPSLAVAFSGYELSLVVMPLIADRSGPPSEQPIGRIRRTRAMLVALAIIMSLYLAASLLVTATLISPAALAHGKEFGADNRALSYLAHGGGPAGMPLSPGFGPTFGSLYDLTTILILCLAGASVTICLRDFLPPYLLRLGMELRVANRVGAMLHLFNAVNLVVVIWFRASVEAQRGAYVTSVLALMVGAAFASRADCTHRQMRFRRFWFTLASILLGFILLLTILENAAGLVIAIPFVLAIVVTSLLSRWFRSTELRFEGLEFADPESERIWEELRLLDFPILVPHRPGRRSLADKEAEIRLRHRLGPEEAVVFIEAWLGDASNFLQRPLLMARREDGRAVLRVTGCASIPHVLAAMALELSRDSRPPEVHFGWSNESPFGANLDFLLFGGGNVPWLVRDLIRRAEPDSARQPSVVIG